MLGEGSGRSCGIFEERGRSSGQNWEIDLVVNGC